MVLSVHSESDGEFPTLRGGDSRRTAIRKNSDGEMCGQNRGALSTVGDGTIGVEGMFTGSMAGASVFGGA